MFYFYWRAWTGRLMEVHKRCMEGAALTVLFLFCFAFLFFSVVLITWNFHVVDVRAGTGVQDMVYYKEFCWGWDMDLGFCFLKWHWVDLGLLVAWSSIFLRGCFEEPWFRRCFIKRDTYCVHV